MGNLLISPFLAIVTSNVCRQILFIDDKRRREREVKGNGIENRELRELKIRWLNLVVLKKLRHLKNINCN
jgi:hypothetical protein